MRYATYTPCHATAIKLFCWIFGLSLLATSLFGQSSTDAGVSAILSPQDGCALTASEQVSVEITNYGTDTVFTTDVAYAFDGNPAVTETFTGTIAPSDMGTYTFTSTVDASATGTYTLDAWTELAGDTVTSNDSITGYSFTHVNAHAFPHVKDFDSEGTCGTSCGDPCPLSGPVWENITSEDDIDWAVHAGTTTSGSTGPDGDHTTGSGNYVYLEASSCTNQEGILRSECLDLTSVQYPALEYWYHMYGSNMGNLYVEVDTGSGWFEVDAITGAQQTDNSDPWLNREINLVPYQSQGLIRIQFRGLTGGGINSDMALDDINLFSLPPDDAGVSAVLAPVTGCGMSASEQVTVEITNFGGDTIFNTDVGYIFDGNPAVTETFSGTILPGGTATYTFAATVDVSAFGAYTLDAWTALAGDTVTSNDSITDYSFTHIEEHTVPVMKDFESESTCGTSCGDPCPLSGPVWENLTTDDIDWAVNSGTTSSSFSTGPDGDHTTGSGNYVYLEASSCSNQEGILRSECLDLSQGDSVKLSYWYHMYGSDMGNIYVEADTGSGWFAIDSVIGEQHTGNSDPWHNSTLNITDLRSAEPVRIQFRGVTGGGFASDMALDDIHIFPQSDLDAGISDVLQPVSDCGLDANQTVQVEITNYGVSDTVFNTDVAYKFNGDPAVTETYTGSIAPGQSDLFTFSTTVDASAPGTYDLIVWTELAGDDIASNDTFDYQFEHISNTLPISKDFESEATCGTSCGDPCPLSGPIWENVTTDDMDWTVHSGATGSSSTGPSGDHTTGSGNYVYLEATGTSCQDATGILRSQCLDLTSAQYPALEYWYHMYGGDMGDLYVEVDTGSGWFVVDAIVGEQHAASTDPWLRGIINLTPYKPQSPIQIQFRGVTGSGFASDMALDNINSFELPAYDAGVSAVLAPTTGCGLSDSEQVVVEITNLGGDTIFNTDVGYIFDGNPAVTETFSGMILPGGSDTYTFTTTVDASAFGAYTLDAWTALVGDTVNTANDTLAGHQLEHVMAHAFPHVKDFDSEGTCGTSCGDPCPLSGPVWENITSEDDIDWAVHAGTTTSGSTGPDGDHTTGSGNYVYLEASSCTNQEGILRSECLDLTSVQYPALEYWYHMYGSSMGNLYVEVDTGSGWFEVDAIIGAQQTDNSDPWLNREINLVPYQPQGLIRIQFRGVTGGGINSDMALDDINLFSLPPDDAGVSAVLSPSTGCALSGSEQVMVEITNFGGDTIFNTDVGYSLNGNPAVIETVTDTILPGTQFIYTFTTTVDASAAGAYTLDAWTALAGDTIPSNDSIVGYQFTHVAEHAVPVMKDFEAESTCGTSCGDPCSLSGPVWENVTSEDDIDWAVNTGTTSSGSTGPSGDHTTGSGNYVYLEASSCTNQEGILRSECLNISMGDSVQLSYWYHMYGSNMGNLYVEADTGSGWFAIDSVIGEQQTNNSDPWLNRILNITDLRAAKPLRIQFRGVTGSGLNSDIALDDIHIFPQSDLDAGISDVLQPVSDCGLDANQTVQVEITNYGVNDTVFNTDVTYVFDGNPAVTETYTGSIPPGQSDLFTFSTTVDASMPGTYDLSVWTDAAGDPIASNDTMNYQFEHISNALPIVKDFENEGTCGTSCGDPCPLSDPVWENITTDDIDWAVHSGTTTSGSTGPSGDHTSGSGNYVYLESSSCYGQTGILRSECIDISVGDSVKLSYWYHMYGADMGNLYVEVDTGTGWFAIDSVIGEQQTANSDPWLNRTLDITHLRGQLVRIQFRGVTGTDFNSDISLDDINIFPQAGLDGGVSQVLSPSSCVLDTNQVVEVEITNYGVSDTFFNIDVAYSVDGGPAAVETYPDTLAPGESGLFTFSTTYNASTLGTYEITAWTEMAGDMIFGNDTASNIAVHRFSVPTTVPYMLGFEAAAASLTDTFEVVTNSQSRAFTDPAAAHSGNMGLILDASNSSGYSTPPSGNDAWNMNPDHFAAVYVCLKPKQTDSLLMHFDLKQIYRFNDNYTNFRITVNGMQVGPTYQPAGATTDWDTITVNLTPYIASGSVEVGFESSAKYPHDDGGAGTGNGSYVDNIRFRTFSAPRVDLGPDTTLCEDETLLLDAGDYEANTTYSWSTAHISQTITVSQPGTYTVTVTNDLGADTADITVDYDSIPVAAFTVNVDETTNTASFTNNSLHGTTNTWDFGDGDTSHAVSPDHTYGSEGTYTVTLVSKNQCDADTTSKTVTITDVPERDGLEEVRVYPNPTAGRVYVDLATGVEPGGRALVTVQNLLGQTINVDEVTVADYGMVYEISLAGRAEGMYLIHIQTDTAKRTFKVKLH